MFLTHALRAIYRAAVVTGDSLWKYVTLLLSGTPPANTFVSDNSNNNLVITPNGDARPSNFSPYTPGYYSNFFDGTGDYLTLPSNQSAFSMGTGDFTVEMWVYITSLAATRTLYDTMNSGDGSGTGRFALQVSTGGTVQIFTGAGSVFTSGGTVLTNTWTHIAYTRSSASGRLFVNGVQVNTTYTDNNNYVVGTTSRPIIGVNAYDSSTNPMLGNISNLRVIKGTAVYTAAFTPSTAPLAAISGTSLLTCQSNRLIDNSINNFAITKTGDVAVRGFVPFTPPTTVNVNTLYSTYFDGTGDYLSCSSSAAQFGTGAFTIECWIYPTSLAAIQVIADFRTTSTAIFGQIYLATNGTLHFYLPTDIATTNTVTLNTWNHIAISRSAGTLKMFINGTSGYSAADSGTYNAVGTYIGISISNTNGFTGYMSNMRFITGTGLYTANFTPPTANLTAISGTSLLTCQNATLVDNSTNAFAITSAGDARPIPVSPFTQVTTPVTATYLGSTYLDGTGDYLTTSGTYTFGTADFTIETWVYTTAYPGSLYAAIFGNITTVTGDTQVILSLNSSGNVVFLTWGTVMITTSAVVPLNAWVHIVAVRNGAAYKVYINGVLAGTSTTMYNLSTPGAANIGYAGLSGINNFTGYISDMRVVQGTAVYTAAFTPPTAPLTAVSGTTLLTCQTNQPATNKMFVDNSGSNLPITQAGNTTQGTFSPYGANWSNYFDGTGDYLDLANNTAFSQTGSWTLEMWVYPTTSVNNYIYSQATANFLQINLSATNYVNIDRSGVGNLITSTNAIAYNAWTHIALVSDGTNMKLFLNGTQSGSTAAVGTQASSAAVTRIGAYQATGSLAYIGYISNVRLVKGTAVYTTTFTPPTAPLTAIAGTVLLTCQSPSIVDNSTNAFAITKNGDVSVQRFSPFSPVIQTPISYSSYFDGSGDYLRLPTGASTVGTNDFSVELWVFHTTSGTMTGYYYQGEAGSGGGINFRKLTTDKLQLSHDGVADVVTSTGSVPINQWVHIAVTRSSGTVRLFINGVVDGSVTYTGNFTGTTGPQNIGTIVSTNYYLSGYISNFRAVVGTAVYTANFTPPTAPLTAVAGTQILTCQSATHVDNSANAYTITTNGDARARYQNPFGFTSTTGQSYTPALFGGSAYFDGTGDYVTVPSNTAFAFGTSDFTVEGWFNFTGTISTYQRPWWFGDDNDNSELNTSVLKVGGVTQGTLITGTTTIVANQWYHIALTRASGVYKLWLNGVQQGSSATNSYNSSARTLTLMATSSAANPATGYVSDFRITKGTALYKASFVPPLAPLTATAGTSLLLNMDKGGVADNSRSVDFETVGDTKIAYETPYAGTNYSNYFDGTGDWLTYTGGTTTTLSGDYTVEAWINLNNLAASQPLLCIGDDYNLGIGFFINSSGKITIYGNNATIYTSTGATVVVGAWTHIAIVRNGTTITGYINGVAQSTSTNSAQYSGTFTQVGREVYNTGTGVAYNGYISNLRLVKGTAVYTANFTPSTTPLTAIANTSLLTCQSKSFVDNSSNNFTLTRNGDVAVKSMNPFQKNTYSSMYFDGTGDYAVSPSNTGNALGTDFTVEAWVLPNVASATYGLAIAGTYDGGTNSGWSVVINRSTGGTYGVAFIHANALQSTYGTYLTVGAWTHIAVARSGSSLKLFVNGVLVTTTVYATTDSIVAPLYVGSQGTASSLFNGYIADLRITKSARYTATFTPPTAPLPTS